MLFNIRKILYVPQSEKDLLLCTVLLVIYKNKSPYVTEKVQFSNYVILFVAYVTSFIISCMNTYSNDYLAYCFLIKISIVSDNVLTEGSDK